MKTTTISLAAISLLLPQSLFASTGKGGSSMTVLGVGLFIFFLVVVFLLFRANFDNSEETQKAILDEQKNETGSTSGSSSSSDWTNNFSTGASQYGSSD